MDWRRQRTEARERYVAKYDAARVTEYASLEGLGHLLPEQEEAYLADLLAAHALPLGPQVLEIGAGTGVLTRMLRRDPSLTITALEPSPAMADHLERDEKLEGVRVVRGFCDAEEDRGLFDEASIDWIGSRQVVSGFHDPLQAFRNWWHWLNEGGMAMVIDGLYGRAGWGEVFAEEVDLLPLAGNDGLALMPYLLEQCGFSVRHVGLMPATNQLSVTRTPRFLVVAIKEA